MKKISWLFSILSLVMSCCACIGLFELFGKQTNTNNALENGNSSVTLTKIETEFAQNLIDNEVVVLNNDITISQTFYITETKTILAETDVIIKRAEGFTGHMFVIGENENGKNSVLLRKTASLSIGGGSEINTITIDGNKENCTNVCGSAFFIANAGVLNIYDNVEISNNKKTLPYEFAAKQSFTYPDAVGGAAIVINCGTFNMFGGVIKDNECLLTSANDERTANGGAIFNRGTFNMYGGEIFGNKAYKGGAVYNYRNIWLYGGAIFENEAGNNGATGYGGAFYSADSQYANIHIRGVEIRNNKSGAAGGAFYQGISCGIAFYADSIATVKDNEAGTNGGAIASYGSIVIYDAIFEGNFTSSSTGKGGAIYQQDRTEGSQADKTTRFCNIYGGIFKDNRAPFGGGAICADSEGIVNIYDGQFIQNKVIKGSSNVIGGGALLVRDAYANIYGGLFDGNTVVSNGGAIHVRDGGKVNFFNAELVNNKADGNGGAICVSGENSETIICGGTISNNNSAGSGGGLYLTSGGKAVISDTEIINNTAATGGAIHTISTGTNLTLNNTTISNNASTGSGGGIYATSAGSILVINGGTISGNTAGTVTEGVITSTNTYGGGIYLTTGINAEIDGAVIENNMSYNGGGIAVYSGAVLTANNITVSANTAKAGGGIYLNAAANTLFISSGIISNNTANNGGGMYLYTGTITELGNVKIIENIADNQGGAIYINGGTLDAKYLEIFDNSLTNNTVNNGGGIYTTGSTLNLFYLVIKGNKLANGTIQHMRATTNSIITVYGFESEYSISHQSFSNLGGGAVLNDKTGGAYENSIH